MQSENKTKKANIKGLQDTRLQFQFTIFKTKLLQIPIPQKFCGDWQLCYATSHTQTKKTTVKTIQLSVSLVFHLLLPHFSSLYFVLFSFSCNQNSSLPILTQRQMKRAFSKSSFASSWDELFTSQSAFVFKHINPLGLPGLFCLILSADSSFLQMLLFCVNRGKYNLLPSSELPHAQLHALTAGHGK